MKNKFLIYFFMFFIAAVSYINPISKTKQIECLKRIVETDIKALGTKDIIYKTDIVNVLTRIERDFVDCKIEETKRSNSVLKLLSEYRKISEQYREGAVLIKMSREFSSVLRIEFSNLIDDIENSLDKINKIDREVYMKSILEKDIKPLKSLSRRGDVLDKLRSISDKLEDFRKLETIQKREILSMLDKFIDEANRDFSVTDLEQNQQGSIKFSTRLQKKFEELIGETGTKTTTKPPINERSIVEKSPETPHTGTQSIQEEQKGVDTAIDKYLGKNIGIAVFILVFIAVVVFIIFAIQKRKGSRGRVEGSLTGEIDKAIVMEKLKKFPSEEKPMVIDEVRKIINSEISDIKTEIIELRHLVKELTYPVDAKSMEKNDISISQQEFQELGMKVQYLREFVDGMENDILKTFKTRFDEIDKKLEEIIESDQRRAAEIQKPLNLDDIENPFDPEIRKIEGPTSDEAEVDNLQYEEQEERVDDFEIKKRIEMVPVNKELEEQVVPESETRYVFSSGEEYQEEAGIESTEEIDIPFPTNVQDEWRNKIVEEFTKNKKMIISFIKSIEVEAGERIKKWIIKLGKNVKQPLTEDKGRFFKDQIYGYIMEIKIMISPSKYREFQEVFLNHLLGALDIEEYGQENDEYVPYMYHLVGDSGGTGAFIRKVISKGYKFRSTGKVIIQAKVEV